jgi:hypothetical protein
MFGRNDLLSRGRNSKIEQSSHPINLGDQEGIKT